MRRSWWIHLLVLLAYGLLAVLFTWPLAEHLDTALPGEGTDAWQYLWNFWWFDQALFHGQPLYFTQAQYGPLGTSLHFHTLSPLHSLLGLPARLAGGYLAAYNSVVLFSSVLAGYGAYLLVMAVIRERKEHTGGGIETPVHLAAFLGGAIFSLAPYWTVHLLGHLSLIATETLPFFALFCWKAMRRPGWKPALGITLSWSAAALIDWYYPLFMLLLGGFFGAWALGEAVLKRRSWREAGRTVATIAGGLLAAAILLSPLLVPMLRESRGASYLEEPLKFSTTYGADLLALFLPSPLHPLWGSFFHRWTDGFAAGNTAEGIVYLGLAPLILAGVALWRERHSGKVWAALAVFFGLLALGPYLKVLHRDTGIPLPFLLLRRLPLIRFTRVPSRYVVLVQLALAVLAGLGAWTLMARSRSGRRRNGENTRLHVRAGRAWLWIAPLLALVVVEYIPTPYPLTTAEIPPVYEQLSHEPATYTLLEVPLQRPASQWYYTEWMVYQTVHGKWSCRGYISRGDPLFPFAGAPLFRQFAQLTPSDDIHYEDYRTLAGSVLNYYRIGYVVLERQRLAEQGRLADAQALVDELWAGAGPAYEDDELSAYRVEPSPVVPFTRLGEGWHEVEQKEWGPFRWIARDRAELFVVLPEQALVRIEFLAVSFLRPRRLEVLLGDQIVAEMEIGTGMQECSFEVPLPAGETRLVWHAEGYDVPERVGLGSDPRPLSIGVSRLRLAP